MRGRKSSDELKALNTLRDNLPPKKKVLLWGICRESHGRSISAKVRKFLQTPSSGDKPAKSAIGAEMLMAVSAKEQEALQSIIASNRWLAANPDKLAKARNQKLEVPKS